MERYVIVKIETDESGEFCQKNKCIGYLYTDHCHCCVLERVNTDQEPVLLESANNERLKRTDACRAAEIELDEKMAKKAQDCLDYAENYPIYAVHVLKAYLAIAKAAGKETEE